MIGAFTPAVLSLGLGLWGNALVSSSRAAARYAEIVGTIARGRAGTIALGGDLAEYSFSAIRGVPGDLFGAGRLQRMRDVVNARGGKLRIVLGDSQSTWERQMAEGFFREAEQAGLHANALIRRFDDGTIYIAFRSSNATKAEVLEELYHLGQIRTGWWEAGFRARETQAGAYMYRAFQRGIITEQEYLTTVANLSQHLRGADPRAVHQLILELNGQHLLRGTPIPTRR